MATDSNVLASLAQKNGLLEQDFNRLVSAWHTDADSGQPLEVFADMNKSRRAGFDLTKPTPDSFIELFDQLRAERLIL